MRILIIEDEQTLAEPVQAYLQQQGFIVDVENDGKQGFQQAQIVNYDCIVLDLNLPGMDGLSICKGLRELEIHVPIIMLTARTGIENTIKGLEIGADDYLPKPFSIKELLLRVQAMIRRNSLHKSDIIQVGELNINSRNHKVAFRGNEVELNSKEMQILEYLVANKGRLISSEELLEHVWSDEIDPFTQTVKTNIKTLRQKIDPDKKLIRTVRGSGYIID